MEKYIVTLTGGERRILQDMLSRGKAAPRKLMHARIVLKADAGPDGPGWDDNIGPILPAASATPPRPARALIGDVPFRFFNRRLRHGFRLQAQLTG